MDPLPNSNVLKGLHSCEQPPYWLLALLIKQLCVQQGHRMLIAMIKRCKVRKLAAMLSNYYLLFSTLATTNTSSLHTHLIANNLSLTVTLGAV